MIWNVFVLAAIVFCGMVHMFGMSDHECLAMIVIWLLMVLGQQTRETYYSDLPAANEKYRTVPLGDLSAEEEPKK